MTRAIIARHRGYAAAVSLFAVLFLSYHMLHPRGFSTAVFIQNANQTVAIAFVAMAQTVPVLIGGLDLAVEAVMTITSCIASHIVTGTPAHMLLGMVLTLLAGMAFGVMNGLIVVYGHTTVGGA